MKIIFSLLLPFILFASNMQYEQKIYATLLDNIFAGKLIVKVWTDDLQKERMFLKLSNVQIVKNAENADILIVEREKNLPEGKLIFATNYLILKDYEKEAIGGFYWKKGRPNIIFLRANLSQHQLKLPRSFDSFIEDRL